MVATIAVTFPSHDSVGPTLVATVAVTFPSHHSVGPTLYNGCYGRGYISHRITPLGQRCIMVATVAVAFPSHDSVGPTLYNGCYGCGSFTSHHAGGRCLLHFRHITPLGQRCIMVATVAVTFPSHHSVGPTLYNGCYDRGYISVARLRWANVV